MSDSAEPTPQARNPHTEGRNHADKRTAASPRFIYPDSLGMGIETAIVKRHIIADIIADFTRILFFIFSPLYKTVKILYNRIEYITITKLGVFYITR